MCKYNIEQPFAFSEGKPAILKEAVDIHHIIPRAAGGAKGNRIRGTVNYRDYPENLIALCRECHNEVEHNNSDLLYLYSRSLFYQGIFLEDDKIKKDSLFLKGAGIGKYSVLNDILFKSILNETKGDSDFKILSALLLLACNFSFCGYCSLVSTTKSIHLKSVLSNVFSSPISLIVAFSIFIYLNI